MEDVTPYYTEDSLSSTFHDLLAELEPGCAKAMALYLVCATLAQRKFLNWGFGSCRLASH